MIDIQTFMLALGIGNTAFALLMAGYMRGAAPNAGLRTWMWARLSSGLAQICCWAAPHAGLRIAEELAAFGWVGGVALEVASYCVFFGFRNWQHKLVPASAAALVAVAVAAMAQVSREQMMQVVAVLVALFASGAAAILLRPQADAPLLQRIIGANDALFAIAIWIWIWMAVANGGVGTFDANPVYGFVYLASYLLMIVNGFGFLLLSKLKDDQRMQRLATIDGLTDMLNRRAFFERAERARQPARERCDGPAWRGRIRAGDAGHVTGRRAVCRRTPARRRRRGAGTRLRRHLSHDGQYRSRDDRPGRGIDGGAGACRSRPLHGQDRWTQPRRDRCASAEACLSEDGI